MMSQETNKWYQEMEMTNSGQKRERPASIDILDMMRLAVNTDDKQWFEELSKEHDRLKIEEELVKAELGFIG